MPSVHCRWLGFSHRAKLGRLESRISFMASRRAWRCLKRSGDDYHQPSTEAWRLRLRSFGAGEIEVLVPVGVVTVGKISAEVDAARFFAGEGGFDHDAG